MKMNKSNTNDPLPLHDNKRSVTPDPPTGPKPHPLKQLREIVEWCRRNGADEQLLARGLSLDFHMKMVFLFDEINAAFGGRTLIPGLPPNAPLNVERFKTHMFYLQRAINMLELGAHLARLVSTDNEEPKASASEPN